MSERKYRVGDLVRVEGRVAASPYGPELYVQIGPHSLPLRELKVVGHDERWVPKVGDEVRHGADAATVAGVWGQRLWLRYYDETFRDVAASEVTLERRA